MFGTTSNVPTWQSGGWKRPPIGPNSQQQLLSELSTRGTLMRARIQAGGGSQIQGEVHSMLWKVTGTRTSLPTPPLCEPSPSTEQSYSVEGYLHKTLKAAQSEVVGHGATLGLGVMDIGDKNTEADIIPFMCKLLPYSSLLPCFLCLFGAISRWLLTCYPTSVIQRHQGSIHKDICFIPWSSGAML